MKLAARLISLYFIIFILPSSVFGGNCTEDELKNMGLIETPGFDKELLFKSSKGMTAVGKKYGIRPGTSVDKFQRELQILFRQIGISEVSAECLKCFAKSIKCVSQHCKGECLKGPCSKGCQNCIDTHCKPALLECIGKTSIPNPCKWKEDYLKYKFPETDEDESTKKGEASGTS
uniref:CD8+ T cell target antigen Tp2 n=1 Tax=Theileria parva TaxID=5875 RepID=F6LWP7_THEPA|nr:CD8+ T cell target antigen Tp2 [Theileria parva]